VDNIWRKSRSGTGYGSEECGTNTYTKTSVYGDISQFGGMF
jgi:hypothetical protein